MTLLLFIGQAVLAALLAFALTPVARKLAFATGAVDEPGPRKLQSTPIARLGGLAVVVSFSLVIAAVAWFSPPHMRALPLQFLFPVAAGLIPVLAISILDDIKSKRAVVKFGFHFIGATIAVAMGIRLNESVHFLGSEFHIGWLAIPISVVWLVGITNAFNLIDGLDGLSAGLALISALSLCAVSLVTRHFDMAGAAIILAGALLGFLPYNLYPAKVYLGDSGATAIGFFLGALTLGGGSTTSAGLAVMLPIVVLGVPLADTLVSMLRRLARRSAGGVFVSDRNHIHHRLLALGYKHTRAVMMLYGVGVILALAGFASVFLTQKKAGLLLGTLLVAAVVGVSKLGYDEFALLKSGAMLRVYQAPVLRHGMFVVFVDIAMITSALYLAVALKYDDWAVRDHRDMVLSVSVLLLAATLGMFAALRIYQRSWSTASVDDMAKLSTAVTMGSILTYVAGQMVLSRPPAVTFMITYTLIILVLAISVRASYRVFLQWKQRSSREGQPVVIYGAGKGGSLALREMLTNSDVLMWPIGFIDDDHLKHGRFVDGYPVLGSLDVLKNVVLDGRAKGVVIASEKIPVAKIESARTVCESQGAWMRIFTVDFRLPLEDDEIPLLQRGR